MHDAYIGGRFRRMKITCKASDVAEKPAIISSCSVLPPEIVMHDAYIGGRFRRTKITRKASDVAEKPAIISHLILF